MAHESYFHAPPTKAEEFGKLLRAVSESLEKEGEFHRNVSALH
jgi:hypothetical protein